jgi:uncharacterized protein YkwD
MAMMDTVGRSAPGSRGAAAWLTGAAALAAFVLFAAAGTAQTVAQAPEPGAAIMLSGDPAAEYSTGEPLAEEDMEIAAEAARRLPRLVFSSNLARAAREIAGSWRGSDLGSAPLELITFVLHASGCADPSAMAALVATTDPSSEPAWRELAATVQSSQGRLTHVGVASARDPLRPRYTRWVMLLVDRRFSLRPLPRAVAADASVRLEFDLPPELRRPWVLAKTPHGATLRFAAGTTPAGFEATLELGHDPGEHVVEILASDEHGPQVVALFPVSVCVPPPRRWQGEAPPAEDAIRAAGDAERYLRELTDQQRRDNGRKELVWDPRLAIVAREHAEDMRDNGFLGHISASSGDVGDRLRRAGYPFAYAAENIARSSSLWEAVESLMRSPGHRANLLATDPTHAGIGVAIATAADGTRTFFVTQVFVRPTAALVRGR